MPRVLALDWGHREVRCLLASVTGSRVKLHLAASAPLPTPAESGREPTAAEVGEALKGLLAGERTGRMVTVVGVNRATIELLDLTLPPAKDAELPELVLHQAMHESAAVTEEAGVDFITLDKDATQPRKVIVAALPAEHRDRIQSACRHADLKPNRIVVRSYASASLFRRMVPDAPRLCLLVDRVGNEADLTLMVEGRPAFFRTVRLPVETDSEKIRGRLLVEIRRTLAVCLEEYEAETVEAIYVFGRQDQQSEFVGRISDELQVPASVFDVFHAAGVPADQAPEDDASFAALLGMVLDEAQNAHAIDFCRSRKPTGPSPIQRRLILGGVAALALVFCGGYYVWDALDQADAQNKELTKELKNLNVLLKKGSDQNKVVEAVHEWLAGDVTWLDELRDFSIRFPQGRDMIVLRMSLAADSKSGGGDVDLQGVVRDPSVVVRMENNVRDKFHEIGSKRVQERVRQRTYSWHFETSMSVEKRDKTQYLSHLPEPPPETEIAAETEKGNADGRRPLPVAHLNSPREDRRLGHKRSPAAETTSAPATAPAAQPPQETASAETKPTADSQPTASASPPQGQEPPKAPDNETKPASASPPTPESQPPAASSPSPAPPPADPAAKPAEQEQPKKPEGEAKPDNETKPASEAKPDSEAKPASPAPATTPPTTPATSPAGPAAAPAGSAPQPAAPAPSKPTTEAKNP